MKKTGIDVKALPQWAQQQIADKLKQEAKKKAENFTQEQEKRVRKYNNTPTEREASDGQKIHFDSKKEGARYDELMLLLKAGEISDLRLQHEFTLMEAYTKPDGERVRATRYKADFTYWRNGEFVVEDVKGGSATKTRVYAMKKKQMYDKYGITIQEV